MNILDRIPGENARSYAVRVLRSNIISLQLPPGSIVSENEISTALNLSRTPIREALIELSRSKLVEILPQKGSYVTRIWTLQRNPGFFAAWWKLRSSVRLRSWSSPNGFF